MSLQFWLDLTVCLGSHSNPPRPTNAWVLCFTVSAAWNVLFIVLCLFIYLLATLLGMCDLSSSTRDWTHDPCITVKVAQSCPHGLYRPWNSPGQNTGVGSVSLLQGIFPTQGSNPGLLHCRRILYQLSHKVSPLHWKHAILTTGPPGKSSAHLHFNSCSFSKGQYKSTFPEAFWPAARHAELTIFVWVFTALCFYVLSCSVVSDSLQPHGL